MPLKSIPPMDDVGYGHRVRTALNSHGEDGWELVGTIDGDDGDVYLSFKRPKDR